MHACAIQGESTGVLHGEEVGWFPTLRRWFVVLGFFWGEEGGVGGGRVVCLFSTLN